MIIGLAGHKRAGKDTAAQALIDRGFVRYALADPIKELCQTVFLWTTDRMEGDHKEVVDDRWGISPRRAMQLIGTELFRERLPELLPEFSRSIWIDRMREVYRNVADMVVTDVRFRNEAEAIHDLGGMVIRIDRPGATGDGHASELEVDRLPVDGVIHNTGGVADLRNSVTHLTSSAAPQ